MNLISYKSFSSKNSQLLENEGDEISQMEAVNSFIKNGIIKGEGYKWNEREGGVNFKDLIITEKFNGLSMSGLPFNIIRAENFNLYSNLTNLTGGPRYSEFMDVSYGSLKSLEGSPRMVKNFDAEFNQIRSLKGCSKYIFGDFRVSNNLITDLNFGPYIIRGKLDLSYNPSLESKKILGYNIVTFFNKMHEDINSIYFKKGDTEKDVLRKIKESIEKKEYAKSLVIKNPYYSEFLKEFEDEIKEFEYLRSIKDLGLL